MSIEIVISAAAFLALLALSVLTWRAVGRQRVPDTASTGNLLADVARLQERSSNLQLALDRLTDQFKNVSSTRDGLQTSVTEGAQKLAAAQQAEKELRERIMRAEGYITDRDEKIAGLEKIVDEFRGKAEQKERDLAALSERYAGLEKSFEDKKQEIADLQQKLQTEFQNIANNVLTNATDRLTATSGKSLANILNPLKERIEQFQNRINTVHDEETKQRTGLSGEIQRLAEAAGNLGQEADAFAKALKGDSGLRGQWGEERLERILEMSGLERDREYVVQGGEFNIKNEEGRSQRPDFIILLPEDRHFIIDSKVTLDDYLDYEKAESDDTRSNALEKLTASCRRHIDDLAGKKYQYGDAINSHDLVLMFMPIEGAAALALKGDPKLFEYAWTKRILIASPGTLFLAMKTVSSIWKYERQNQNAKAIAAQAGKLFDKLAGVVDDLNDVSDKIYKAAAAHDQAMKKLASGKGNALATAQKLRNLGVTPKNSLKFVLIEGEKQAIEDEDEAPIEAPSQPLLAAPES